MAKKYPALFALAGVMAGIIFADNFDVGAWSYILVIMFLILPTVALYYKGFPLAAGVLGLIVLATISSFGYSFQYKTYPPGHIIHFTDDNIKYKIYGIVDDWPMIREHRTSVIISVDSIGYNDKIKEGRGRLLINIANETTALQYHDCVALESRLYSIKGGKNPTGYDYRRFLNLKGVFAATYLPHEFNIKIDPPGRASYYRIVDYVRKYITETFHRTLEPNPAALASGFLIGDTRDIPPEVYRYFRDSGTLHLLAVSGSNVALIVLFFSLLLKPFPISRGMKTFLLLLLIVFFTSLAYNQPSVVRASVMAVLVLMGRYFQKRIDLNNIIASTALIILLVKPTDLFNVGFQLSFITAWGLIFFVPKLVKLFKKIRTRFYFKYLIIPFLVCVVAQMVSLPMSAYYFQRMPMISFLSNIVIVPLVSIIVMGEVLLVFLALLYPLLGDFAGSLLNPLLNITLDAIRLFGSDQFNVLLKYQITGPPLVFYYIFLMLLSGAALSKRMRRLTVLYFLLAANIIVLWPLLDSDKERRLTVFSVPAGIVAVAHLERPQVILSDLPEKDYLYGERMIETYLANRRVVSPDLISLSGNPQNLREICYFLEKDIAGFGYLPLTSKNLFSDMVESDSTIGRFAKVGYYGHLPDSFYFSNSDILLTDGILCYLFDSSAILFISRGGATTCNDLPDFLVGREVVVVTSRPESDFPPMSGSIAGGDVRYIICNYRPDPKLFSGNIEPKSGCRPNIIELSQTGAVELIIRNGRIDIGN